jgi:hypothetical protein
MTEMPSAPEVDDIQDADDWGSQWEDIGNLPLMLISETSVALVDLIISGAGVSVLCPAMIPREAGYTFLNNLPDYSLYHSRRFLT